MIILPLSSSRYCKILILISLWHPPPLLLHHQPIPTSSNPSLSSQNRVIVVRKAARKSIFDSAQLFIRTKNVNWCYSIIGGNGVLLEKILLLFLEKTHKPNDGFLYITWRCLIVVSQMMSKEIHRELWWPSVESNGTVRQSYDNYLPEIVLKFVGFQFKW